MAQEWSGPAAVRRWYVLAAGMLLTAAAMAAAYAHAGVHWARAEVTLVAPAAIGGVSALLAPDASLIPFTTIIERTLDDAMPFAFVSDDAPFYAVTDRGRSVRQVDTGGQWTRHFSAPTLIVEVVAPDPRKVEAELSATIAEIESAAHALQEGVSTDPEQRITVTVDEVRQAHIAPGRSGIARAWAVIALGGLTVSLALCRAADLLVRPRRSGLHRDAAVVGAAR